MYVRYFPEKEEEKGEGVKMMILTSVIHVSSCVKSTFFFTEIHNLNFS